MSRLSSFAIILFFLSSVGVVFSQKDNTSDDGSKGFVVPPEKSAPVTVPKFASSPVIDGNLDEDVWKNAAQFKNFVQTEPGYNIAPSRDTIAYMGYDEKFLYIGFFCFDEPDKIRTTVAKRDEVGGEDYVGVFLDTFDDKRRAYILQFNALGIQGDGIKTEGDRRSDFSVDIVMESKGMVHKNGWSVEVKIPFKSLRYKAGKGTFWGVDFWRRIDRFNRETDGWMPMEKGISELRQLGRITGLDDIKTERTLEIVPSVTISESGERIEDTNSPPGFSRFLNRPVKSDIGVSLKYQITPNITLDAAVNPDFAEVEADAPVVRANQRFPIFFPEKRPFFLEGIDIFRSRLQVVNTRNIANPDVALKLTGKVGKTTFGVLGAVDDFPNSDSKAFVGVLRLKRDIGENSNIGLFATQYHFGAKRHNNLFGVDGKIQVDKRTAFNYEVIGTSSRRFFYNPDTNSSEYGTGNGVAYRIEYDYTGRNRGWSVEANGRSRNYRADVGFNRRTNVHGARFGYRLQSESRPKSPLIRFTHRGSANVNIDESGRLVNAEINAFDRFQFQNQLSMDFRLSLEAENIYEDEFGARRNGFQNGAFFGEDKRSTFRTGVRFGVNKRFNKRIGVSGRLSFDSNVFDLDFGASERFQRVSPAFLQYLIDRETNPNLDEPSLDPGKGNLLSYQFSINLKPTDPFNVNFSYRRRKLTRKDTKKIAFDSNIFTIRSTYQFTRYIFTRARWDYSTVRGNVNGQLLFGWSPNPGTAFFVGYNDSLRYKGFNNFTNRFDPGLLRNNRSFFIRMSYLFRKSF